MSDTAVLDALRTMVASGLGGIPLDLALKQCEAQAQSQKAQPYRGLIPASHWTNGTPCFSGKALLSVGVDLGNSLSTGEFLLTCPEVVQHMDPNNAHGGHKIHAIKKARALLSIGLKEAKEAVEAVWPVKWNGGLDYSPNPNYKKVI